MSCRLGLILVATLTAAAGAVGPVLQDRPAPPLPDQDTFLAEARSRLRSDNIAQGRFIRKERETSRERDSSGRIKKTTVRVIEVYPSASPDLTYRRVLSVNGVTPADLARKDDEYRRKVLDWIVEQGKRGLTPEEAARRKRDIEERKERAIIDELPTIYEFRMQGRELIDGRSAIAFVLHPRPDAPTRSREAGIIKHFAGRIWLDEREFELVRADMESIDTVTYGWGIVARLGKGAVARFERRKLNGDVWLPIFAHFRATGRVMLVKSVRMDETYEYLDYRPADATGITTFPLSR